MKTYLQVPYELRFEVKNKGARWDPARKLWYVPDGTDLYPFLAFVPNAEPDRSTKRKRKNANRIATALKRTPHDR